MLNHTRLNVKQCVCKFFSGHHFCNRCFSMTKTLSPNSSPINPTPTFLKLEQLPKHIEEKEDMDTKKPRERNKNKEEDKKVKKNKNKNKIIRKLDK